MGGADTKFEHLLLLLHRDYDITVVPNTREQFEQVQWRRWLAGLGVKAALLEDLPPKLSGWGLSLCNGKFWGEAWFARLTIAAFKHISVFGDRLPFRVHVEKIHEEVIGERLSPSG